MKLFVLCVSAAALVSAAARLDSKEGNDKSLFEVASIYDAQNLIYTFYPLKEEKDKGKKSHQRPFTLVSFAHGYTAPVALYAPALSLIASYGFVIVASDKCNTETGCGGESSNEPECNDATFQPPCMENYFQTMVESLKYAEARQNEKGSPFYTVDFSRGSLIVGQSAGGQAALILAANREEVKARNIIGAALLSPFWNIPSSAIPTSLVPILSMSGTLDEVLPALPVPSFQIISTAISENQVVLPRGLVIKTGGTHNAPWLDDSTVEAYAEVIAGWFKVIEGTKKQFGIQFADFIFGENTGSVCNGGFGFIESSSCLFLSE